MADLVLGLAKTAVEGTVAIARTAIEEEDKLQKSVKRDLLLISDELEMMNSFLNVARDRVVTDDVTGTLVRQVRNMALDVEDCIETVVHLDDDDRPHWWRRLLPSCLPAAAPAAHLDSAAADMELLKARVEAMGQRNLRYSRIGDPAGSKPTDDDEQAAHRQGAAASTTASTSILLRSAASTSEERFGHTTDVLSLLITRREYYSPVHRVISVFGTVGVASVIKRAYEDQKILEDFRCRAWVKLAHPFNPREFIRSVVAQFCSTRVDFALEMEDVVIKEFMEQMSSHKYLVVLEGVSSMDDWEAVRVYLPHNEHGSCIVVNTHQLEVASLCVGHPQGVHELEKLSAHHPVYALSKEEDAPKTTVDKLKIAREWLDEHPLVGRELDLLLYFRLNVARRHGVLSVWGISGVGKSFLVKHFYYDMVTALGTPDWIKYGWVNVSRPFDLMDLSWSLLLDLNGGSLQDGMSVMQDPIQGCHEYLRNHRCIVVIDGLQSTEEWDLIKAALGLGTTQHCVVVITSEESVAKYCATASDKVWSVKGLGVDHAFEIIAKSYKLRRQGTEDQMHILHKCGGLPKVICAVAGMHYKEEYFWEFLRKDNFVSELKAEPSLEDLFVWLLSYFHSSPDVLKPCIFYLSIFPLNHIIRRRRLVRRWIAEGYSRDSKESTAEKNGEMSFSKLVNLSMIQVLRTTERKVEQEYFKRMPLCQVNGFFREYIVSQSMEDNLVFALEGHCVKNLQRTGRHLAIDRSWDRDQNVYQSIDFTRLRSLTVVGQWESFFVSDKMRLLRVLDLEDVSSGLTNRDVEQMVKLLPRLKFLSLRGCREISHLPDSLGDLKHLQTLDIKGTSVIMLPPSIIKLEKLQYLRAGGTKHHHQATTTEAADQNPAQSASPMSRPCAALGSCLLLSKLSRHRRLGGSSSRNGVKVPGGIGKLSDMHTLGMVDIGTAGGDAILEELKKLTLLHKLGASGINRSNILKCYSVISGLAHLESLSLRVQINEDDEAGWLDDISFGPLVNLLSLKLYGLGRKLPKWTTQLKNLRKLSLQLTMLPEEGIDDLADSLPELDHLRLFLSGFQDDELHFGRREGGIFLGLLEISCNSRVQATVTFHDNFLLKVLRIRCWGVSSLRFSGLQSLKALEEAWLASPYDDGLKQHLESELAKRPEEGISRAVLRLEEPGSCNPWLLTSS